MDQSQVNPPAPRPQTPFSFTIGIGGEALKVSGTVPDGGCAVAELVPLLLGLGEGIVGAAIRQNPADRPVSCGPGCGACCRQLVPVSLSEAAYLTTEVLPNLKKSHRRRVGQRLAAAAATLEQHQLLRELRQLPAITDPEQRQAAGLRFFLLGLPCPFLEDESCSIHPMRPLACRQYLVTSPPARCSQPDQGAVRTVPIPQKPSQALIQLDAARTGTPGWRTLIDALLDERPPPADTIADPIQFLKDFLGYLLKSG